MNETDDPEASYRRGYQQGAKAMLDAVGRLTTERLNEWVDIALFKWRHHDQPNDRSVGPPPAK